MAKQSIFDPEFILPKLKAGKEWLLEKIGNKKKLFLGLTIVFISFILFNNLFLSRKTTGQAAKAKTITVKVDKSFDFPALNNQGKPTGNKIKFTIASAEKTNQVLVNDKLFTAKNNKLFLILNLELKNDATQTLNILPGDLIRLTYMGNEENKFAPDLHNNLVPIAAISTKLERIGFVIPQEAQQFKLYIGELEGKKETIEVIFPLDKR